MKSKLLTVLLTTLLIFSITTMSYAGELVVEPVDPQSKEEMLAQFQDRLRILDEQREQFQERARTHSSGQSCFNDVEEHWAKEQIQSSYDWGFVGGFPDGSFLPNSPTTGTQSILMVRKLIQCFDGLTYDNEVSEEIDWDVVPAWAKAQMQESTTQQIAKMSENYGTENTSRLEFALLLAKSLKIEKMDFDKDKNYYLDQNAISASDLGYVLALREMGIISGSNGRFYPNREITRAEVAVILNRVMAKAGTEVMDSPKEDNKGQEEKAASG